jgi:ribosomal protein S11
VNVNVKITLTDEQRNAIACKLAGKQVARLATRADINALCQQAIEDLLAGVAPTSREVTEFCSDDCCNANAGLLRRINILQHRIDTGRS